MHSLVHILFKDKHYDNFPADIHAELKQLVQNIENSRGGLRVMEEDYQENLRVCHLVNYGDFPNLTYFLENVIHCFGSYEFILRVQGQVPVTRLAYDLETGRFIRQQFTGYFTKNTRIRCEGYPYSINPRSFGTFQYDRSSMTCEMLVYGNKNPETLAFFYKKVLDRYRDINKFGL